MANRSDAQGLFWHDEKKVKAVAKAKTKRIPPLRTWESPDYLPNLAEAQALVLDEFNDMELWQASINREQLLFDMEIYPNYVLAAFRSIQSKKVVYFELSDLWIGTEGIDAQKFIWILQNFCIINFNGRKFDFIISALLANELSTESMWLATQMLIVQEQRDKEVYKYFKIKRIERINQIDLIELTALGPGLKKCAGRLHAQRLQDLPFKPGTILSPQQATIVRWYCFNDLDNTELLYHSVEEQLQVRIETGLKYGLDLRSHSDAQMAEAIIASEIKKLTGRKHLTRTTIPAGTTYKYKTPHFIKYKSDLLNWLLNRVQTADFVVGQDGAIIEPDSFANLVLEINKSKYSFGIGGLHSQEKNVSQISNDEYVIKDTDVRSYYPWLILNAGLTPPALGKDFIVVYNGIVVARVNAKKAGEIIVAECLKIVANGTFGKLGSMWSIMYAPDLFLQVTITGQLSILMLAERFELAGFEVVSINTDGIVAKCLRNREEEFNAIVKQWEQDTGLETEETRYKALYSKDINNYIAVYETPQKGKLFKAKGLYGPTAPKKNAVNEICVEAATEMILHQTPIMETIMKCKKISMFTSMREVAGGAVKILPNSYDPKLPEDQKAEVARAKGCVEVEIGHWLQHAKSTQPPTSLDAVYKWSCEVGNTLYLGKLIRWYYAKDEQGEIISAKSGNKVARTDNAKPCMNLPAEFPNDINFEWYEKETVSILEKIGYLEKPKLK